MGCSVNLSDDGNLSVTLEGFSGPLDLLCQLVERGKLDVARISLVDLLGRYVEFLMSQEGVSLREIAEFFSFASRMVLTKVRRLFPSVEPLEEDPLGLDGGLDPEGVLRTSLERYRPIRKAAIWLEERQIWRERFFVRQAEEGPLLFEAGDLFALGRVWWSLVDRRDHDQDLWDGYGEDIEDTKVCEYSVEEIMEVIERRVAGGPISLRQLMGSGAPRGMLIASILALLELCRLGRIRLLQEEPFDDIVFSAP
ncbi:MAG: segregation/condensation protein A [Thermanaerothrix sp.]|nr:segregation/condensation protein A [Thermanaerothrix sp.]